MKTQLLRSAWTQLWLWMSCNCALSWRSVVSNVASLSCSSLPLSLSLCLFLSPSTSANWNAGSGNTRSDISHALGPIDQRLGATASRYHHLNVECPFALKSYASPGLGIEIGVGGCECDVDVPRSDSVAKVLMNLRWYDEWVIRFLSLQCQSPCLLSLPPPATAAAAAQFS